MTVWNGVFDGCYWFQHRPILRPSHLTKYGSHLHSVESGLPSHKIKYIKCVYYRTLDALQYLKCLYVY